MIKIQSRNDTRCSSDITYNSVDVCWNVMFSFRKCYVNVVLIAPPTAHARYLSKLFIAQRASCVLSLIYTRATLFILAGVYQRAAMVQGETSKNAFFRGIYCGLSVVAKLIRGQGIVFLG